MMWWLRLWIGAQVGCLLLGLLFAAVVLPLAGREYLLNVVGGYAGWMVGSTLLIGFHGWRESWL